MIGPVLAAAFVVLIVLTILAWRRYLWAAEKVPHGQEDTCPYSLTDVFGDRHLVNVPHQEGVQWLTEIFSRTVSEFPHHTALQIPDTGESLTFAELDARAETLAAALAPRRRDLVFPQRPRLRSVAEPLRPAPLGRSRARGRRGPRGRQQVHHGTGLAPRRPRGPQRPRRDGCLSGPV